MGISPAQIIVFAVTAFDNFFKAAHSRIIAARMVRKRTHPVMRFFFAVKA